MKHETEELKRYHSSSDPEFVVVQIANQIRECDEAELYIVKSTLEGISGMKKLRSGK